MPEWRIVRDDLWVPMATVNAADLVGIGDKTGAIRPGLWAGLIAVEGNPLEGIRRLESVSFVMKAGTVYRNSFAGGTHPATGR